MINVEQLSEGYSTLNLTKKPKEEKLSTQYTGSSTTEKVAALSIPFLLTPTLAMADTFGDIHGTIMTIFDGGVVLIIIFAGAAWSLGHRSKALELLIGVCCGYLLARHSVNIRDYLKSIGN